MFGQFVNWMLHGDGIDPPGWAQIVLMTAMIGTTVVLLNVVYAVTA